MAKYIASESDISDPSMETETTYVESQDTETSLGSSADKRSRSSILSTVVILLVELCERLTYYTLAGTQKVYLQNQLGRSPSTSAAMNSAFSMLCYFWCIPGGLLADSVGRYKTIVMAGCVYALGAALVALAVIHEVQNTLDWLFMLGCFGLIALGTGGIKPNIANFGADQIGDETEKQRESQKTFFSLFYLSINIGVLIAFGFLTNITTGGLRGLIPMEDGYSFAYGMGAVCMAFAVLLFVAFTRTYTRLPGNGTGAFRQMVWYHWYSVQHGGGWRALISAVGFLCLPLFFVVTLVSALFGGGGEAEEVGGIFDPCAGAKKGESGWRRLHGTSSGNDVLSQIALVLGFMSCVFLIVANVNCSWVKELDDEMKDGKKDGTKIFSVKEAQQTFSAVPVIVVVNIAFNLCYNSMNTFPSQACQMDLRIGKGQLNGAFFNIADAIAIVVITPILESCIYPMVARMKGSNVRLGQKIIAGLIIACISNLSAAVLEIYRKQAPALCDAGFSQCAPGYDGISGTRMRDISAFWIFIPFALVGIAEVLVNPCMYCFSYEAAPVEVRSLLQAFNLFFQGSVSNAFTASVSKLAYPNNLDEGHLEYYYYVNAALALIGIGMYYAVTRSSGDQEVHATVQE